jgi:hypothetical protein
VPAKPGTPASVILEVISRTCGRPAREGHTLRTDLGLNGSDLEELRVALELALKCELGDFEIDGGITVSDLIEAIRLRSHAA